ncbi:MAG: hypothetical protein ACE5H2_03385 [Terriglobia bacterium]
MSLPVHYAPPRLTAEKGLTLAAARAALYRWLWARQQGVRFAVRGGQELWQEELAWLGITLEDSPQANQKGEVNEPGWLARLPEILPSEPTPWGTGRAETPVAALRTLGVLPETLMNFLALLGWRPPEGTAETLSSEQLLRLFNPEQIILTPLRFDPEKLRALNRHWLQLADLDRLLRLSLPDFHAAGYLPDELPEPVRLWLKDVIRAVLPGLDFLSLLPQRTGFIFAYSAEHALAFPDSRAALERQGARAVIREFGRRVLADNWPAKAGGLTATRLAAILEEVKQATHYKGWTLLGPVRVILTGLPYGPELAELVPIFETGSQLNLPQHVKSCRERVLEFCSVFV